ncbi:DEAD/DEAH box helicase family protein [Candidatus Microthrix parvicella]|uniref:type I restriction endonuclease subunit R n=1 Tax=Candidatus Neomicrothrix parvicella TaxID=41950 RepID=UPI00037183C4|nr:DEAD/DEAH box helicase family protein [Candidatus Microthrix parvicella]
MVPAELDDYIAPENKARARIDEMLQRAGWVVQDYKSVNLYAGVGVAVRELVTNAGPADYVLFINRQAVGVIEAKKQGTTLAGVEWQTVKYQSSIPEELQTHLINGHLPFGYESTGDETWFTCRFDPEPTARRVFWFHRPESLDDMVENDRYHRHGSLRAGVHDIEPLPPKEQTPWLRDAQHEAITNLETSLQNNRPRALIQMATGSGKTFAAANIAERLITQGGAKRILFLVDRGNLGKQTLKEFHGFDVPGTGRKFNELYNVQHLTSNVVDPVSKVCISTIQRVYSILRGDDTFDEDLDEHSTFDHEPQRTVEVDYNEHLPIEAFDVIIVDECHRSIYGVWRQVLEYFDAFLIGLTATPGKQTFGFFNQNLVMEYGFPQAVADGVNVDFDVFRLSTAITESGSTIEGGQGYVTSFRNRETRQERLEAVDEDLTYDQRALDRKVVSKDQIRTVVKAFRDNLPAMFPNRDIDDHGRLANIPKTLIFAKDDSHAEDIVRIAREEFGKGNDVIAKITYKSSDGNKPEDLLQSFRTSYNPRIAVTVDMIATGTDVKPIEAVLFMRMVRSRNFFEQMKGRGVRTIDPDALQAVTPDAVTKDRFVLIDAVGVTETKLSDSTPLERKRGVPLAKLLHQARLGHVSEDLVSSLASRLARLDGRIAADDRERLEVIAETSLSDLAHQMVDAIDPDRQLAAAQMDSGDTEPDEAAVEATKNRMFEQALLPIASNPELCEELENVQRSVEQLIDEISKDTIVRADFVVDAESRAKETVESFRQYLEDNQDEITGFQAYFSKPYTQRPTYADIKALADAIGKPPRRWTPEKLWEAYGTLDESKVRGSAGTVLTNLVSLVRFALGVDDQLEPWPQRVRERFDGWMAQQQQAGRTFTADQAEWLALIRDHLAASLSIELVELQDPPFSQHGGLFKARELFGHDLDDILADLTETLAA